MANFAAKYSIMTQEMVDSFWDNFYIPTEVHPTTPKRGKIITQFPAGKVGVYSRIFDVCGYRILFTKFFMAVLKHFRVHISQLSPFGAARVSHFKVLTRAPSCFPKPPDSIKNWADHFFWVDSCVFPISVPLYTGGTLEKDSAPHLTARQEQTVKLLEIHNAPFRRYPECFLCLMGLSPYYPFDENSYPDFEYPDGSEMGLFDFIKTADPRKVQAVKVQKGDDQVTLLESTQHCFMPLLIPAAGGISSAAAVEVVTLTEERQENVAPEEAYLELADPDEGTATVRQSEEEVVTEQPKKVIKKRLLKQSDVLPAKKLRTYHPTLVFGTGGKTVASLEQIRQAKVFWILLPKRTSGSVMSRRDTTTAATTFARAYPDLADPSQPEESEGFDDSFYEPPTLDLSEVKRWYVPRWNITNNSLLDDGFSCRTLVDRVAPPAFFSTLCTMDYDHLYTEFNVGAAWQICLGAEVRSRTEHELELKEKLRAKYVARGRLLEEKDLEILRLKSQLAKKEAEAAEVIRLRDQVSSLFGEKSALTAEVLVLKVTVTQKDHDISLLKSRAACLASTLDDAKVACAVDFKERMEIQQEKQAQELFNRVAELEAHGIMGHALGRAVDFGMQEGIKAGYEHGAAGRNLSVVNAYNLEVAKASFINAVKALEDVDFPLVNLLKSKKDAGMDKVLDCFLLDGPLAGLSEAAYLQSCIEQLSIPIHHARDNTAVGETSLSFA
ncbi:hypothetical protein Tco_1059820 [Tanacetum coccineum]